MSFRGKKIFPLLIVFQNGQAKASDQGPQPIDVPLLGEALLGHGVKFLAMAP